MLSHKILWACAATLGVGVLIALAVVEFAPAPYGHSKPTAQRSESCSSKMSFGKDGASTPCIPPNIYLFYEGYQFGEETHPLCFVYNQTLSFFNCKNSTTFESQGKTYDLCLDPLIELDLVALYELYLSNGIYTHTFQIDFLFQYVTNDTSDPCDIHHFYENSSYPITYFPVITASTKNFSKSNPLRENLLQVGVNSYNIFNLYAEQDTTQSDDLTYAAYLSTASPIYYGISSQDPTYIQTIVQIFPQTTYTIIEYEQDFTWIDYVGMVLGVIGGSSFLFNLSSTYSPQRMNKLENISGCRFFSNLSGISSSKFWGSYLHESTRSHLHPGQRSYCILFHKL